MLETTIWVLSGSSDHKKKPRSQDRGFLKSGLGMQSVDRRAVIHHHAVPEGLAGVDEPQVMFAVRLIVVVVLHVLEVEGQGVVEGVVRHRALLGLGGLADEAVHEVGNLLELDELTFECVALVRIEIGFEPEVNVVEHGGRKLEG